MMMRFDRLAKFAWGVLVYNLLVIVLGGFVRATGSGAGCGSHWPLCNGVVVPVAPAIETVIEFTHRVTSGVTVVLIIAMCVWVWRLYPKGHVLRWTSGASVFFIFTESLIGAGLVLFRLVENNDSITRAFSMMAHLVNTLALLAALALTAWFHTFGAPLGLRSGRMNQAVFGLGVVGMFILGASGAVTALGDTLFPSTSLLDGIQQEFSATAHYLLRLRVLHPPIAIVVSIYAATIAWRLRNQYNNPRSDLLGKSLIVLVGIQLCLGLLNVWLLAPIWLQMVHLLMTTLIWIVYILAGVTGLISGYLAPRVGEEQIQQRVEQAAA